MPTSDKQARVTCTRATGGDGDGYIRWDIELPEHRLKMEMALPDFALLVTGRAAVPAAITKLTQPQSSKVKRIHTIPVGDLEIHCAQTSCWCHPIEVEPGLFVHNAKDCREARERTLGQLCSEGWVLIAEMHP